MHWQGHLEITSGAGERLTAEAPSQPGVIIRLFHLGTTGYYGWNDWVGCQWDGDVKVEGNHVVDCDKSERGLTLENSFL